VACEPDARVELCLVDVPSGLPELQTALGEVGRQFGARDANPLDGLPDGEVVPVIPAETASAEFDGCGQYDGVVGR
jgi:hypothetical protein